MRIYIPKYVIKLKILDLLLNKNFFFIFIFLMTERHAYPHAEICLETKILDLLLNKNFILFSLYRYQLLTVF